MRAFLYTVHSIGQTEWDYYKPANVTVKDLHLLVSEKLNDQIPKLCYH